MAIGVHYKGLKGKGISSCSACSAGFHEHCKDKNCICRSSHYDIKIVNFVSALGFIKKKEKDSDRSQR